MGTGSETTELSRPIAIVSFAAAALLLLAMRTPPKSWLLDYYPNSAFEGEASKRAWVGQVNLKLPGEGLVSGVPDRQDFSLRLQSCLPISSATDVAFRLNADDHARLYVDGKLLVDSVQPEPPVEPGRRRKKRKKRKEKKHIDLQPGNHLIVVEYSNTGGTAAMHLDMTQNGTGAGYLRARLQRPSLDGRCDKP